MDSVRNLTKLRCCTFTHLYKQRSLQVLNRFVSNRSHGRQNTGKQNTNLYKQSVNPFKDFFVKINFSDEVILLITICCHSCHMLVFTGNYSVIMQRFKNFVHRIGLSSSSSSSSSVRQIEEGGHRHGQRQKESKP